jgi:hypothetical protein
VIAPLGLLRFALDRVSPGSIHARWIHGRLVRAIRACRLLPG